MWSIIKDKWAEMLARYPERERIIIPERDGNYAFPDTPNDFAYPFIEICGNEFHYVVRERGKEYERHKTTELDELFSWITSDYTLWLASRYELRHRRKNEDSRRQWMSLHVALLRRSKDCWADHEKERYDKVLSRHPFSDEKGVSIDESEYKIE